MRRIWSPWNCRRCIEIWKRSIIKRKDYMRRRYGKIRSRDLSLRRWLSPLGRSWGGRWTRRRSLWRWRWCYLSLIILGIRYRMIRRKKWGTLRKIMRLSLSRANCCRWWVAWVRRRRNLEGRWRGRRRKPILWNCIKVNSRNRWISWGLRSFRSRVVSLMR